MVNCVSLSPINTLQCIDEPIGLDYGIKSFYFNNKDEVYFNEVHVGNIISKEQQGEDLVLVFENISNRKIKTRIVINGFYKLEK